MHGGDDKITSQPASEEFSRKANVVAEYKIWDGMYHEIHNEPEKEAVLQHVVDWIRRQINR